MKDTYYFPHDYNAMQDEKIKMLIRRHGMEGYGIFWGIVEMLYNNANALRTDYEGIAYDMRTNSDKIESIINDFELFIVDGDTFGSMSVERRLNERKEKSRKAKESASYRWDNANALRTECDGNAIKEKKVKEKKEKKEIKENKAEAWILKVDMQYREIISMFIDYKKSKNQSYKSEKSFMLMANKLISMSNNNPDVARQIVEQSMINNWAGLFELKQNNNKSYEQTATRTRKKLY